MALVAFEHFAEKAGIINSQLNELIDEINDLLNGDEVIGDEFYVKTLLNYLEVIEGQWLDIYELQEDYKND